MNIDDFTGGTVGAFIHSLDLSSAAHAEWALLVSLTERTWTGAGAIVDCSSTGGRSTAAIGEGLRANPNLARADLTTFPGSKPVHAFARTIDESTMDPYRELVEVHIGALQNESWGHPPIEIAFIDACQTALLNAHVSGEIYPALRPVSRLVHRDHVAFSGGASRLVHRNFFSDRMH